MSSPAAARPAVQGWRAYVPRPKLSVFLAGLGGFVGLVTYDRREAKKAISRNCARVAHLAQAPMAPIEMPRKVRIVLAPPPGDGVYASRDYFTSYIKPVLCAAAVDYEISQGEKEGHLRAVIAEEIRQMREPKREDDMLRLIQKPLVPSKEWGGNLIVGRSAWKEFMQGLHEGWLGPLSPPASPAEVTKEADKQSEKPSGRSDESANTAGPVHETQGATEKPPSPPTDDEVKAKERQEAERKQRPYITPEEYPTSKQAATPSRMIEPISLIPHSHLIGFLKTPWRIYRFVTRRYLADDISRRTVDCILASRARRCQDQDLLFASEEELEWPKRYWKREDAPSKEWTRDIVSDPRVTAALRFFESPDRPPVQE